MGWIREAEPHRWRCDICGRRVKCRADLSQRHCSLCGGMPSLNGLNGLNGSAAGFTGQRSGCCGGARKPAAKPSPEPGTETTTIIDPHT